MVSYGFLLFFFPSLVSKPNIFCLEREENQNGPISVIQQILYSRRNLGDHMQVIEIWLQPHFLWDTYQGYRHGKSHHSKSPEQKRNDCRKSRQYPRFMEWWILSYSQGFCQPFWPTLSRAFSWLRFPLFYRKTQNTVAPNNQKYTWGKLAKFGGKTW